MLCLVRQNSPLAAIYRDHLQRHVPLQQYYTRVNVNDTYITLYVRKVKPIGQENEQGVLIHFAGNCACPYRRQNLHPGAAKLWTKICSVRIPQRLL